MHVRAQGSPGGRFAVEFRDWLRSDAAARDEYAEIKLAAMAAADGDRDAYVAAKEPWFDRAYARVAAWRAGRRET